MPNVTTSLVASKVLTGQTRKVLSRASVGQSGTVVARQEPLLGSDESSGRSGGGCVSNVTASLVALKVLTGQTRQVLSRALVGESGVQQGVVTRSQRRRRSTSPPVAGEGLANPWVLPANLLPVRIEGARDELRSAASVRAPGPAVSGDFRLERFVVDVSGSGKPHVIPGALV